MLRKGATSISIMLLTLMTLLLISVALFTFVTGQKGLTKRISASNYIDEAYMQEAGLKLALFSIAERNLFLSYKETIAKYFGMNMLHIRNVDNGEFETAFFNIFMEKMKRDIEESEAPELAHIKTNLEDIVIKIKDWKLDIELKNIKIYADDIRTEKKRIWIWRIIPTIFTTPITTRNSMIYLPKISRNFDLEKMGFLNINQLNVGTTGCKDNGIGLELSFNYKDFGCIVHVAGKKSFFDEGKLDFVAFSFLQN